MARLRRWTGKYSPWVSEESPASLLLDITGCAHLFGGEASLAEYVAQDLMKLQLTAVLDIADTPGAAWHAYRSGKVDPPASC